MPENKALLDLGIAILAQFPQSGLGDLALPGNKFLQGSSILSISGIT
jgi:hypothetical protein